MNEALKNQIIYEADYILNNNQDLTIPEFAKILSEVLNKNICQSTLQKHLRALEEIDQEKYEAVRAKIDETSRIKNSIGGSIGKRKSKYDPMLIRKIALEIISTCKDENHEMGYSTTLSEASEIYHIPKQTLSELFKKMLSDDEYGLLKAAFDYNSKEGKRKNKH